MNAWRPWEVELDPHPYRGIHSVDSQEKVDKCLSCTLPPDKCRGMCYDEARRKYQDKRRAKLHEKAC